MDLPLNSISSTTSRLKSLKVSFGYAIRPQIPLCRIECSPSYTLSSYNDGFRQFTMVYFSFQNSWVRFVCSVPWRHWHNWCLVYNFLKLEIICWSMGYKMGLMLRERYRIFINLNSSGISSSTLGGKPKHCRGWRRPQEADCSSQVTLSTASWKTRLILLERYYLVIQALTFVLHVTSCQSFTILSKFNARRFLER